MSRKLIKKIFSFPSFMVGVLFGMISISLVWAISFKMMPMKTHNNAGIKEKTAAVFIKSVVAAEIYPEFVCGCCGKPLDPNNICCGDMRQKINYIDALIGEGFSEDEIMMKTAKKFGFNSLANDEMKLVIKNKLIQNAPEEAPKIIFEIEKIDLGIISQKNGVSTAIFNFKNEGQSDLIINNLNTSCGCTSAAIVYGGKESPSFTMPGHGKENPKNWSVNITPGDTAQVKVYYDPNAHGPMKNDKQFITRTISIFSNDPVEFERQLRIDLEQTP